MARLLILGGSDAGTSAALRAREVASSAEVTLFLACIRTCDSYCKTL